MPFSRSNSSTIFTPTNFLPTDLLQPRLRREVMADITNDPEAYAAFQCLNADAQEALIEFCMGNRGLKITYDPFFHKIFHPKAHPKRLSRLISAILCQPVTIKCILPREGIRLSDDSSLMIMDVLVELSDGSLINVEIQRHGYYFPMQRSFCYGADLLVRQYAQLRDDLGENFSYNKMRPVFVIVLMESSPQSFSAHPETYLHRSRFRFDSGLALDNLLNFIYIPLDIFREMPHNDIGELEAWLYFLGSDNPLHIQRIIEKYPFFKELYQEIINFRYHPKELITMFSEALAIMDRNTINLMIDDLKAQLTEKDNALAARDSALAEKDAALAEKDNALAEKTAETAALLAEINQLRAQLSKQ